MLSQTQINAFLNKNSVRPQVYCSSKKQRIGIPAAKGLQYFVPAQQIKIQFRNVSFRDQVSTWWSDRRKAVARDLSKNRLHESWEIPSLIVRPAPSRARPNFSSKRASFSAPTSGDFDIRPLLCTSSVEPTMMVGRCIFVRCARRQFQATGMPSRAPTTMARPDRIDSAAICFSAHRAFFRLTARGLRISNWQTPLLHLRLPQRSRSAFSALASEPQRSSAGRA